MSWPYARVRRYRGGSPPGIQPVLATTAPSPPWGGGLLWLDEPGGQRIDDELDPVVAAGLAQNRLDMGLDRRLRNMEPFADLGIAQPSAHEGQDGVLPPGQGLEKSNSVTI